MKNLTDASQVALMKEFYSYAQTAPPTMGRQKHDKDKTTGQVN